MIKRITSKVAAKRLGISQGYLNQLARAGRIIGGINIGKGEKKKIFRFDPTVLAILDKDANPVISLPTPSSFSRDSFLTRLNSIEAKLYQLIKLWS